MTYKQTILRENGNAVADRKVEHFECNPECYLYEEAQKQGLNGGVYFVVETFSDLSFTFHCIRLTKVDAPTYTTQVIA